MTIRISKRDWEALSAYIDGQLSPRERARLESRLQTDSRLQSALEELRRTRSVLRSLPKLRAPRNYTLTPQMVPVRQERTRGYPILSLASAMATLLLVLVLVGDFFAPRQLAMAPAMVTQLAEAEALEEPGDLRAIPPGVGGGEPPAGVPGAATPTIRPTPKTAPNPPDEGPTEPPVMMEERPASPPPGAQVQVAPESEAADVPELLPTPESEIVPNATLGRDLVFRILEIGLAVIALTTGVAAFVVRRRVGG